MRKAPDIWRRWGTGSGNGLHSLQLRITLRWGGQGSGSSSGSSSGCISQTASPPRRYLALPGAPACLLPACLLTCLPGLTLPCLQGLRAAARGRPPGLLHLHLQPSGGRGGGGRGESCLPVLLALSLCSIFDFNGGELTAAGSGAFLGGDPGQQGQPAAAASFSAWLTQFLLLLLLLLLPAGAAAVQGRV